MTETIQINWLLLLSPFLWVLGISVIVALLGLMEFLGTKKEIKRLDFLKKPLARTSFVIGMGLIILGLLLDYARLPSKKLILVKLLEQNSISMKNISVDPIHFAPQELKMDSHNKSHVLNNQKMIDNTMVLFWDGYIETPFIQFKKGDYIFKFLARGSKAEQEFSKIKVEFELPDNNNYLKTTVTKYIECTGKMQPYQLNFKTNVDTIGRIRISYFNDIYIPETNKGRDVWMKYLNIRLRRPCRGPNF
jgi:hypothetical protein